MTRFVSLRRLGAGPGTGRRVGTWPLFVIAVPAGVAVWSGWVGLGQLTGFGVVHPLPGIADQVTLNTAITLPVGVEAYAAYAMRVWFAGSGIPGRARSFAAWSAMLSLLVGLAGQAAYHLMQSSGVTKAPWGVVLAVSCLPVAVFGMAMALAHLVHSDDQPASDTPGVVEAGGDRVSTTSGHDVDTSPDNQADTSGATLSPPLSAPCPPGVDNDRDTDLTVPSSVHGHPADTTTGTVDPAVSTTNGHDVDNQADTDHASGQPKRGVSRPRKPASTGERVAAMLRRNPSITVPVMAERLGVHPRTVRRYLPGNNAA